MFAHDQYILIIQNHIHKLAGYFLGVTVILSLFLLSLGHPEYVITLLLLSILLFSAIHCIKKPQIIFASFLLSAYIFSIVSSQLFFLGWDSGFQYYLLNLLPIILMYSPGKPKLTRILLSQFILCFVVLYFYFHHHVSDIHQTLYQTLYIFNAAAALIGLKFQITSFINVSSGYHTKIKELKELAYFDPLTGVLNRSGLNHRLSALNFGEQNSLALCDIDHFKSINDSYGHLCGDYVLKEIAQFLSKQIRSTDVIARWGGEEFVLIFPQVNIKETERILLRMQKDLEKKMLYFDNQKIQVSLTLGYNKLRSKDEFLSALKLADEALYHGKQTGRNQIVSAEKIEQDLFIK